MTNFKNKYYSIEDFIEIVKQKKDRSEKYDPTYHYEIYCASDKDDVIIQGMAIYVGDGSTVDGNYIETYPEFVSLFKLSPFYSSENFQDVIDLAFNQKKTVSSREIIDCLNYFSEHDDFLDIK